MKQAGNEITATGYTGLSESCLVKIKQLIKVHTKEAR